ncbi:MAG: ribosomal protein S18-alanine N-acetyltransferase [Chloroflexi bacterium]|nr:ribosomal protein S18-alanine N-acetyltransferase [Chloroflexota bacterium]
MDIALRRMRAEDIPQVIEIEQEAFNPGWVGTPFRRELNSRYTRFLVAYRAADSADDDPGGSENRHRAPAADESLWGRMLTGVRSAFGKGQRVVGDDLAGYVGIWLQGDQAHITEVAVREELRGRGIGELLIIGTLRVAYEQALAEVTLEARVSNFVAQRLYDKYGFNEAGIRKNYYADNREDAVIMTTDPIHTAAYRAKFATLQENFVARYGETRIEI